MGGNTIRALVFTIVLLSVFSLHITSATLTQTVNISSTGTINYPGLRVQGGQIVDEHGRSVVLRGFSLWECDVFTDWAMPITAERMQQIKEWGFNTVNIVAMWAYRIEPDENRPSVYNEENLQVIDDVIQLAEETGLYVTLSMRISGKDDNPPTWHGWATCQRMEDEPTVRQRFYDAWSMLIQRFDNYSNVIGYNWWFFPWHQSPWGTHVSEEADIYYDIIVPNLLDVTRAHTGKIIFFTVYKQGEVSAEGVRSDTGEFAYIEPIADNNVVYCHGFHRPHDIEWKEDIRYYENGSRIPWDYDIEALRVELQEGLEFKNQYNVPMMVTEVGLHTYEYPLYQDRLDCYDAKLSLMDEYGWNWLYWLYSNQPDTDSGVLEEGTYEPFPIVDVLRSAQ